MKARLAGAIQDSKFQIQDSRAKQILRGVYPEPLLPHGGIRSVRKRRANGLRMTVESAATVHEYRKVRWNPPSLAAPEGGGRI